MNSKGLLKGLPSTQDSRFMRIFLTMSLIITQKCPKKPDLACVFIKIRESLQFKFKFGGIHFSDRTWIKVIQGFPVLRFDGASGHIGVMSTTQIWPEMTPSQVLGKHPSKSYCV